MNDVCVYVYACMSLYVVQCVCVGYWCVIISDVKFVDQNSPFQIFYPAIPIS